VCVSLFGDRSARSVYFRQSLSAVILQLRQNRSAKHARTDIEFDIRVRRTSRWKYLLDRPDLAPLHGSAIAVPCLRSKVSDPKARPARFQPETLVIQKLPR